MKQNLFANGVPESVTLPFATVTFMPEPVASDVTSLHDLPNVVLEYMDAMTSLVHKFYLKVERKADFREAFDVSRAADLARCKVYESISMFGNRDANNPMSLEPNYPFYCYGPNSKLRDDADASFMRQLTVHALPPVEATHTDPGVRLTLSGDGACLAIQLPNDLAVTIENYQPGPRRNQHERAIATSQKIITGEAILFGQRARLTVETMAGWLAAEQTREIAHWIPAKVLREAIDAAVSKHFGEHLGSATAPLMQVMLHDINFINLTAKLP